MQPQQLHQHSLPIPLVGIDYGGYPSAKNANIEKSLDHFDQHKENINHEYDDNIELFLLKPQNEATTSPFSPRNQDIKKQYYRYNLLQNKIQAIGNDPQINKIHKATNRYFKRRNNSMAVSNQYQTPADVISSARQQQLQDEVHATDPRSARNMTALLVPQYDAGTGLPSKDYSKTPNIKERQQSHFKRFKYSVSGVDEGGEQNTPGTARGTSFLPAVHGQEHLKKKVNKA